MGLDGDYGFAPANYIEVPDGASHEPPSPALPRRHASSASNDESSEPTSQNPAAALAGIMHQRQVSSGSDSRAPVALPPRPQYTPQASDEEDQPTPSLPARPQSQSISTHSADYPTPRSPVSPGIAMSPPHNRVAHRGSEDEGTNHTAGGYHLYNINEMVSVMGKRKKMPTTLGINLATGTIMIAPEKTRDGPQQEWTADKMTHYSIEGKHVFLELVRPSKSVDFHAGAKDTAQEIVAALGEMAGAVKAEGLREVILAGAAPGQKKGIVLYDFMAQGDDEVSVAIDDEVIILDDTKSEEWWQVRRIKNDKEGVVPSSYIEITGTVANPSSSGINAGRSTVEQNRLEEQRLAKDAVKSSDAGPPMRLPERGSSLSGAAASQRNGTTGQPRSSRSSKFPVMPIENCLTNCLEPDPSKVRTWTDRSKSFSVEAQFLALKESKIHLHKMNGVKIAVPVSKMSVEDLEYVERITGVSLDEDKPLSAIKSQRETQRAQPASSTPVVGATIEPKRPAYDWFQFFLSCDVAVGLCDRYAQSFARDSMDESVLPDVDATVLRSLGIREGDIIKVMRYLDNKYGRKRNTDGEADAAGGGLFSGPGGALKNNTRKGRPAPAVQTSDVVDPSAFSMDELARAATKSATDRVSSPAASASVTATQKNSGRGFDDDAWDVKPVKQTPQSAARSAPAPEPIIRPEPQQRTLTGAMQELSLLTAPLEPIKVQPTVTQPVTQPPPPQSVQQLLPQTTQPTGATPAFFSALNPQQTGLPQAAGNPLLMNNPQLGFQQQQMYGQQQAQPNIARQRPAVPPAASTGSLMPPPPPRPLSAPQSAQQSAFGPPPLQPQMTGMPNSTSFQPPSLAPPGQSLAEINQMRMHQQFAQQQQQQQQQGQMQPQMTGFAGPSNHMMPQPTGYGQINQQANGFGPQMQAQPTGYQPPFMNNQATAGPFADPRGQQFSPLQPMQTGYAPQQIPQQTGINAFLPPALQPQQTGFMAPQATGMNGFGQNYGQAPPVPPMPAMPHQSTAAPLIPQKTGPPPPVRFGVTPGANKLAPQPTGRRANLAAASK